MGRPQQPEAFYLSDETCRRIAFEISDIVPGKHYFSARSSGFEPLRNEISVSAGIQLELGDVPLVRAP